APERTVYSITGSRQTDTGTLWHNGSSTKYRARSAAPSKKTPLNGASETPGTRPDLAARYEQLRHDIIGGSYGGEGLGRALFLRRGMTAWMQAWSECAGNIAPPPTPSQSGVNESIPVNMRSQITTLLVGMILSLQQETTL